MALEIGERREEIGPFTFHPDYNSPRGPEVQTEMCCSGTVDCVAVRRDGEPGPTYLCPVLVFLRLEMGQQSVTMVHSRAPPLLVITPDQARPGQSQH